MDMAIWNSQNWVESILQSSFRTKPGTQFNYSTTASHLMAVILAKATKQNLLDYANKVLFKPLNISIAGWNF